MRIETGEFLSTNGLGAWWPAFPAQTDKVWRYSIPKEYGLINKIESSKKFGYSVRCIKD